MIGTYVGFVSVAGQAAAWWIVGLRQQRAGRVALLSIAGLLLIAWSASFNFVAMQKFWDIHKEKENS